MSTQDSYDKLILENIIKQILYSGQTPTTELIDSTYESFINGKDFSQPQFDIVVAETVQSENASAAKWNNTNYEIWRDLKVAYDTVFDVTNKCVLTFDRWRSETLAIESKLKSLEDRITNLIQTQLKKGTHYISETFSDTTNIDLTETTAYVSIKENNVSLNTSDNKPTRINLNYIISDDVSFTVLSRTYLQSVANAPDADLINAFNDLDNFWQARVYMSSAQQSVSSELKFKISDTPISISRISCKLHSSNTNSDIQITPMTSSDGVNFSQLNISNVTTSVTDTASWSFPSIDVTHIKLIMTKQGFDSNQNNSFVYEFGMQEIAIYNLAFDDNQQSLASKSLFVSGANKKPIPFHSVTLDVCENLPDNTNIQYFISALHNIDDNPSWVSVDPLSRTSAIYPSEIAFGDKKQFEISNVGVSYDSNGAVGFVNPGADYLLTTIFGNSTIINTPKTSTVTKYVLNNLNDRLLKYELDSSIAVDTNTISIFRNVGAKGDNTFVRNIQRGWTYEEPYYISVVEVQNPNGMSINFGDQYIILDGNNKNGIVHIDQGIHQIKIRKNNWINIDAGLATLADLKTNDPLFPFNQKLLVEGYNLNDPQNPYLGVDIFAGYSMDKISLVDFNNNVEDTDYRVFAIDVDAVDTNKVTPSLVFMVKSDSNTSDFLDELFTIRFTVKNQTYNYVKFKALLSTLDYGISPYLSSYNLKLSD